MTTTRMESAAIDAQEQAGALHFHGNTGSFLNMETATGRFDGALVTIMMAIFMKFPTSLLVVGLRRCHGRRLRPSFKSLKCSVLALNSASSTLTN
jgi:hypothetical protein